MKSFSSHIIHQFFNQIFAFFLGIVISIITSRILGAEGRGDFALLINASTLMYLILGFSLDTVLVHMLSSDKFSYRKTINTITILIPILLFFGLFILLGLNYLHIDLFFPKNISRTNSYVYIMYVFALTLIGVLFRSVIAAKKLFHLQQKQFYYLSILSFLLYLLLFFYYKNFDEINFRFFLLFYIIVSSIPTIGIFFIYKKNAAPVFSFHILSAEQIKHLANFSVLAYFANIFQFLSYRIDFWFIEYYRGATELGIYSLASNLAQMLWVPQAAISTILIAYAKKISDNSLVENPNRTPILLRLSVALSIILGCLSALIVPFALPFLYGESFSDACRLFQLLLLGVIPFVISIIIVADFIGKGNFKHFFSASLLGLLACLICDIIFIPIYGSTGAAYATALSYNITTFYLLTKYKKENNLQYKDLLLIKKTDITLFKKTLNLSRLKL